MSRDEELLRRAVEEMQSGVRREANARLLFERLAPIIHRYFFHLGFSAEESRDFTQEVFFRVYINIGSFRRQSSIGTWVLTIATNFYRNEIRKRRTKKRDQVEKPLDEILENDPGALRSGSPKGPSAAPNPLQELLDEERRNALWAAVEDMPDQMRTCFRLRYERDYKYREIAVLMRISEQTVKAHLHQAHERLKERLGLDLGTEPEDERHDRG
jgi:RNA polymerase sigma-70 factor (ECF subfamily)